MEENKLNLLEKENAELKKSVACLEKQLEEQKGVLLASQDAANQYKDWWFQEQKKREKLKEDIKVVSKMYNILSQSW